MQALGILLLLGAANLAPILATRMMGARLNAALDGGLILPDGRALFGAGKTLRGIISAILVTSIVAALIGMGALLGAAIGAAAMAGDLAASFCKRRIGLPPHARAVGLDQIPEALLPLLILRWWLGLSWLEVAALTLAFMLLDIVVSWMLFQVGIRKRPY